MFWKFFVICCLLGFNILPSNGRNDIQKGQFTHCRSVESCPMSSHDCKKDIYPICALNKETKERKIFRNCCYLQAAQCNEGYSYIVIWDDHCDLAWDRYFESNMFYLNSFNEPQANFKQYELLYNQINVCRIVTISEMEYKPICVENTKAKTLHTFENVYKLQKYICQHNTTIMKHISNGECKVNL